MKKEKLIMTQINGRYPENSTRGHDKEYEPKQNATFKTTGKGRIKNDILLTFSNFYFKLYVWTF